MKTCCDSRSPAWRRRAGGLLSWLAPTAVLALMPKCPACLAGYIALATGIGLSLPTAEFLRAAAVALSGMLLGILVVRWGLNRRGVARRD